MLGMMSMLYVENHFSVQVFVFFKYRLSHKAPAGQLVGIAQNIICDTKM